MVSLRCWLACLPLLWGTVALGASRNDHQINVLLIMADDLGYHDLSCYGHSQLRTPVLDQLAQDGAKLTSYYAGATVCTPSRMALLTGSYPSRLGWRRGVVGYLMEPGTGLHPQAVTIAEVFQQAGYQTGIAGKWHLGETDEMLPRGQGFQWASYIKRSNNQTDELWENGKLVAKPFDNRRLSEHFTQAALRFLEAHHQQPFFLYVPYTAPHFPVEAHPQWEGHSAYGVYGDVVEELDARVGELLDALASYEIAQRTIVVFVSDNGPEPQTKASRATPWRGRKWDALEGGTRVPGLVRLSGTVPAGTSCDALVSAIDWLPTLASACGLDWRGRTDLQLVDGKDVWATLCGGEAQPRELLYWHGKRGFQAIRQGDWKLFPRGADALRGLEGPALFHLADDREERRNRSAEYPDRVAEMQQRARALLADIEQRGLPLGTSPPARQ